ncbi:MAG: hypothetical protein QM761_06795 [Pseudoxanthomonas sp.]
MTGGIGNVVVGDQCAFGNFRAIGTLHGNGKFDITPQGKEHASGVERAEAVQHYRLFQRDDLGNDDPVASRRCLDRFRVVPAAQAGARWQQQCRDDSDCKSGQASPISCTHGFHSAAFAPARDSYQMESP